MAQKAVAGRHWFIIISSYLCCYLFLFPQLEGRLEIVHIKSDSLIKGRQGLAGDDSRVTIMANEPTNNGPILLLNPSLIVLSISSRSCELDVFSLAVGQQSVVDERAIIIGVDSQDREGNLSDDHLESFHHQFLASGKERNTLYPPRADIDRNQTMDISPSRRAAVMLNKINLQISRWRVIPVGEGSDSDTSARLFRPWPVPLSGLIFFSYRLQ